MKRNVIVVLLFLLFTFSLVFADAETEPNNVFDDAGVLTVLEGVHVGEITSGDSDYWSFEAVAGDDVLITTEGTTGSLSDTKLWLYDVDGTSQVGYNDDTPGAPGYLSTISYLIPADGVYFFEVGPYGSGTGTYDVLLDITEYVPALSCYDVQFTEDPSGDSPYKDQSVSVRGIVTAIDFAGGKYFIQDSEGGPWSGLYIYDDSNPVTIGDQIVVSGTVVEYFNLTEVNAVTDVVTESIGNTLPGIPTIITTDVSSEQWESVTVNIQDVVVSQDVVQYGQWYVDDGLLRAECQIDDGFNAFNSGDATTAVGTRYNSITGIVDYGFGEYAINPRSLDDLEVPFSGVTYRIELYDSYGDGWNGGVVSVAVGGALVIDAVTIGSGDFAEFPFNVANDDEVSVDYAPGSWSGENSYAIFDDLGNELFSSTSPPASNYTFTAIVADTPFGVNISVDEPAVYSQVPGVFEIITTIHNVGSNPDVFDLNISGATWPVQIMAQDGVTPITSVSIPGFQKDVIIQAEIPAGTRMESNNFVLTATSQGNSSLFDEQELSVNLYTPVEGDIAFFGYEDGLDDNIYYSGNVQTSSDVSFNGVSSLLIGDPDSRYDGLSWAKYTFDIPAELDDLLYLDINVHMGPITRSAYQFIRLMDEDGAGILQEFLEEGYWTSGGNWISASIDVSEYAGQTITAYFETHSEGANNAFMYLDDLKLHYPVPTVMVSSNLLEFGEYQVGQMATQIVTISNPADAPVDLEIYSINSSSPYFSIESVTRTDYIAPGASKDYQVSFAPAEVVLYEEYFTFVSNDPFTLPPFGNGVRLDVEGAGVAPFSILGALPNRVDLFVEAGGNVDVRFDVSNEGVLPLDLYDITMVTRDLAVDPGSFTGIGQDATEEITVSFASGLVNNGQTGAINFTTNEPPNPPGEDFEVWPPVNFDLTGGTDEFIQYSSGGNTSARANYWGAMASGDDAYLTSVVNDISSFASPALQFDWSHKYSTSYPNDALTVRISSDGATWEDVWYKVGTELESSDGAANTAPGSFTLASIPIPSSYFGGDIYVQFYAYSGWGPDLFIDNVAIVDGSRSLTEGSPQEYSIPVAAYTLEGYESYDETTGYNVVNSIVPEALRTTDIPTYEWFDNVNEENLWDWVTDETYELPETMDFMGQEINTIGLDLNYIGYPIYSTFVSPTVVMIPDAEEVRDEDSREIRMPEKLPFISNRHSEDNENRNFLTENCISAAGNIDMAGAEYVSSEEFGTVVTWNYPGEFVAQIIMYKSGEIKINYKEVGTDNLYFSSNDPDVGIKGLTNEVRYSNPAWVFSNLMPEMSIKFSPEFDDAQMLPAELTMIEDEVYLLDVSAYIATGGEVLDVVMTDSENIATVIDGNMIELHTALNFNSAAGETIGYAISGVTRSIGEILVTVDAVNDLPEVMSPLEDVILAEDFGIYTIPINNVFEDVDSEISITVGLSDDTKVDAEIVGTDLVFTAIQDMFTDVPVEVTLTATELDRSINLSARKSIVSSRAITTRDRAEVETMFLLTITPVNDVPVVLNAVADFSIEEDGSAILDLLNIFYDPDGDDITLGFDQVVDPHLNLVLDGSMLTITPDANWNGEEAIVITCDDGIETVLVSSRREAVDANRDVATDDFMVTVTAVNDAPVVVAPIADFSFDEDTIDASIDLNVVFADYDVVYGDVIDFTVSGDNNITVELVAGIVTLTPALNWNGIEVLTFTATDLDGAFVNEAVQIVVDPVNDVPTIDLPEMISFNEGTMLTRNFGQFINDVDGDELTLTVTGNTNVVVGIAGLTVVFNSADPIYYGSETLTFTISDGQARVRAEASDDIEIVVNYVNEAPVYVGPTYIGTPDIYEDFSDDNGAYTIGTLTDLFTDQEIAAGYDWTSFTFEVVDFNSAKIDAYIEDGDLKITSVPNAFGLSTLRVKANDNDAYEASRAALSFTQNIEIYLESVNDLPYFMDLQTDIEMAANSIQYIYFDANVMDVDDPTPVLEITGPEGFVTITKLAGYDYRFKFDALGLFDMLETITLTLDDGNGGITEAQIEVSIAASEPPYTTYLIPIQEFDEDFETTEIIDLTTCFADPDDAELNYSVSVNTMVGGVPVIEAMIDADNFLWIGSSIENWYGEAEILVNCWDGVERYTITQNVGVIVNPVNDLPTVVGDIADQDLQEDFVGFQVADLTTIFNDVDEDFLLYQVTVSETDILLPVVNGTMLDLTPLMDMYGNTTVTVSARDNSLPYNWIEADFMVNVNAVMDYPNFMGGINGGVFEFNIAGEILDLTPFVDTHNQVNTAPISYVFTPLPGIPEPCYEITQNPYPLYGFTVTPIGYQPENWHVTYPDQECTLILDGGDQIVVTFTTNLSPFVLMPIEDMVLVELDRNPINLDSYFADPMDLELSYDVIYETDVLDIALEGSMLYINDIYNSDVTNVTVVASNTEERSTCAQTFQVVTMVGTNFNLMIVDNDRSSDMGYDDVSGKVMDALSALGGFTYDVYDYGEGDYLDVTYDAYDMVLWFTGDAYNANETLRDGDMANIAAFIDNGGWFYLNSQDFLYDVYEERVEYEGEYNPEFTVPEGDFAYNYLGVHSGYHDYWEYAFRTVGAAGTFLEGFYADIDNSGFVPQRHEGIRNDIYTDLITEHAGMDLMVSDLEFERTYGTNSIMYGTTTFSTVPFLGYSDEALVEYFAYIFAYYNGMYIPTVRGGAVEEDSNEAPVVTALKGNYPNPFNPTTNIMFALSEETNVEVEIFNIKGQKVRTLVNETMTSGDHSVVWNGTNDEGDACGSGIYFYKLRAASRTDVKKMLMLK